MSKFSPLDWMRSSIQTIMDFAWMDPSLKHCKQPPQAIEGNPFTELYYACLRKSVDVLKVKSGDNIKMPTLDLLAPTKGQLYVFPQYTYLVERLDAFWKQCAQDDFPPAIAIIGTPGMGSFSPFDSHAHPL
jgi:hypothetical protein